MQLAHAADQGIAGLVIDRRLEGRVFAREALQRLGDLALTLAVDQLDRQRDHRFRHMHAHQTDALSRGERIAGGTIDPEQRHDIAGARLVEILQLIGVHAA